MAQRSVRVTKKETRTKSVTCSAQDWESGDPSKECIPSVCSAGTGDRFKTQINCLNEFLDIDAKSHGHCRVVELNDCKELVLAHPEECSIPSESLASTGNATRTVPKLA